jgi:hypothetical protein
LGANPTERVVKSQDLNTALIFWSFFIKEKGQYSTILCKKKRLFHQKKQKTRHFNAFALLLNPQPSTLNPA